jgi:UDP-N-acetylmuramoylalanine--D-glutamate ligase
MTLRSQSIAVIGCATSGIAAARLAKKLGATVTILDSSDSESVQKRAKPMRDEGFSVLLGKTALTTRRRFDLAVLSPGIDPSWPLARKFLDHHVPTIGELEFAYQQCTKPIIAITGTNGKTTTTELVERILLGAGIKTIAGANYGVAFSELISEATPVDYYTLEVSSFQLELIRTFHPKVAVWLNFAPDHLDRHPSLDAYHAAKLRIFENQTSDDVAILNGAETYPLLKAAQTTFSAFQINTDFHLRLGKIWHQNERLLDMAKTHLRGLHNAENVMAAMAAAHAVGVSFDAMEKTLSSYRPPRHRCELIATIRGREFINDSKATNLHAMESALRGFERKVVLIAGGKQKGLDYAPLTKLVSEKVAQVFTIGEIRDQLATTWGAGVPTHPCDTLESAVKRSLEASTEGQTILFSPGTSSFDMFNGYEHRGNAFAEIVQQLKDS